LGHNSWLELIGPPGGGKSTWLANHLPLFVDQGKKTSLLQYANDIHRFKRCFSLFSQTVYKLTASQRILQLKYMLFSLDQIQRRHSVVVIDSHTWNCVDEGIIHKFLSLYSYCLKDAPWCEILPIILSEWNVKRIICCSESNEILMKRMVDRGFPKRLRDIGNRNQIAILNSYKSNINSLQHELLTKEYQLIIDFVD
jgi:hypothetical protein